MAPAGKDRKEAPAAGRPHTALHKPAANIITDSPGRNYPAVMDIRGHVGSA